MGLFEDVVVNAKSAVSVVGKKAGQIVDISKLRFNAAEINNEISKRFESLGRVVYDGEKTENNASELVAECVKAIDELYDPVSYTHLHRVYAAAEAARQGAGEYGGLRPHRPQARYSRRKRGA